MRKHVSIRMTVKPLLMRDVDTADNKRATGCKRMNVHTDTRPQRTYIKTHCIPSRKRPETRPLRQQTLDKRLTPLSVISYGSYSSGFLPYSLYTAASSSS